MEITIKVKNEDVASLLVSAIENTGGMSTWFQNVEFAGPNADKVNEGYDWYAEGKSFDENWLMRVQADRPNLEEGNGKLDGLITPNDLRKALVLMAEKHPRHFADMMNENADATTADVFLQLAIYGDVHFG